MTLTPVDIFFMSTNSFQWDFISRIHKSVDPSAGFSRHVFATLILSAPKLEVSAYTYIPTCLTTYVLVVETGIEVLRQKSKVPLSLIHSRGSSRQRKGPCTAQGLIIDQGGEYRDLQRAAKPTRGEEICCSLTFVSEPQFPL